MREHVNADCGNVLTVTGIKKSSDLGTVLPFEHLLIDAGATLGPPVEANARHIYFSPVDDQVLSDVRYYGYANQDVLRMGNIDAMVDEVLLYKQWGGGTIVDCTSAPLGRDPTGLARVARRTGVNVLMSTSCESAMLAPDGVLEGDELFVNAMVGEVMAGVGGHGIRAGLIVWDEDSVSGIRPQYVGTTLRACVEAQGITGAPLLVRPGREDGRIGRTIDLLAELDVTPEWVVMGRMGGRTREELTMAANAGFRLVFDSFGSFGALHQTQFKGYDGQPARVPTADNEGDPGLGVILDLLSDGYEDQVLMSHGIGRADRLARYGGHGYFYVLGSVVPALMANGASQETVDRLVTSNPQRALCFKETR